jgi:fumarate hydratase, class I
MNAPSAFPDPKPVPPYKHTPLFPLGEDTTPYKKIRSDGVRVEKVLGKDMLVVSREALRALSEAAFGDINHYLRPGHLKQLRSILDDPEASDNDKFVAFDFLKNANIAAGGAADVPGHRYRHHHGQEGRARAHRWGRRSRTLRRSA